MTKRVTLKEIAERLGVSQNTVSLVLRGMPGISDGTRRTILKTALEMGYVVRKSNAQTINICVMNTYVNNADTYYFARLQKCIESHLVEKHCKTITVNNIETYSLEAVYDLCMANEIAGIIMVADMGRDFVTSIQSLEIPVLCSGFFVPGLRVDSVLEDNIAGMITLANRLKDYGMKRVGFIGSVYLDQGFFERWMALGAMLEKLRLIKEEAACMLDVEYALLINTEYMAAAMRRLKTLPDVLVCGNDNIAITVIKALEQNSIRVPRDVCVVGFDNRDLAHLSTPTIATVDTFLEEQAQRAVLRLLQRIEDPKLPYERILCGTQFIHGESLVCKKKEPV